MSALYLSGRSGRPEDVPAFVDIMTGGQLALSQRPFFLTFHLDAADERPARVVLALPIYPYCADDAIAHARILALFQRFRVPAAAYLAACDQYGFLALSPQQDFWTGLGDKHAV